MAKNVFHAASFTSLPNLGSIGLVVCEMIILLVGDIIREHHMKCHCDQICIWSIVQMALMLKS